MNGPYYIWHGDAGECDNKTDSLEEARAIVDEFKSEGTRAYITNADNEVIV
jgi:hypothetical protein